jgi:hypothetical protein
LSLISKPFTFTVGAVIVASQHNSDYDTIYSDYNGNIDNTNLASGAAIADTKLAQITTAGKVSGAALTGLSSIPSGAGVLPAANGGIPSGIIVMWSGTIATIPTGFYLCNGSNGTPYLRNFFVVGADADSGGVAKSTVTGSALQTSATGVLPAHTHDITLTDGGGGTDRIQHSTGTTIWGTLPTASTGTGTKVISVFYALAYIMKS